MTHRSIRSLLHASFSAVALYAATGAPAHAYVDPGTGSMLLQLGLATVASVMFYFRSLRLAIVDWFKGLFGARIPDADMPGRDGRSDDASR